MSKECENIYVLCECSLKDDLSRRGFNSQMAMITCSMDNSYRLFLHLLLSLTNGLMNIVAMVAGMKIMHGVSNIRLLSVQLPATETNTKSFI